MNLAPFLVSVLVTIFVVLWTYRAYERVHNPRYGNWVVESFFSWTYVAIGVICITLAQATLILAELMFDEITDGWMLAVIGIFALIGILGVILMLILEDEVKGRMLVDFRSRLEG